MKCLVLLLLMVNLVFAKQYERCELAKELYEKHNVTMEDVGMLVCFAEYTSKLQTSKYGHGSYGLFQLNGNWCSKDDFTQNVCDMKCTDLIDDDITDDVKCFRKTLLGGDFLHFQFEFLCLSLQSGITEQCFPYDENITYNPKYSSYANETHHEIVMDDPEDN